MKKKNLLAIIVAVALVAALAVGATLAYFTDNDAAQNTFTMGKVDINLIEKDENGTTYETGMTFDKVLPGDTKTKIAQVVVDKDSEDCYVRVLVDVTASDGFTAADKTALYTAIQDAIAKENVDSTKWIVTQNMDGSLVCTYTGIAKAEDILTLFTSIQLPTTLKNNVADGTFQINLKAYAIQAANVELYKTGTTDLNEDIWAEANFS